MQSESIINIRGEFIEPELENRFQLENETQNQKRMIAICLVTVFVYCVGIIINFLDFGISTEFYDLLVVRIIVALLGILAAYAAFEEKINACFSGLMMSYMSAIGFSESLEAILQYRFCTENSIPIILIIVLMYYLFIPVNIKVAVIPSLFSSLLYPSALLILTDSSSSYILNLFLLFFIINMYGIVHLITFNKIRRREFYTLLEQEKLNQKLQKEIEVRQKAEEKLRQLAPMKPFIKPKKRDETGL